MSIIARFRGVGIPAAIGATAVFLVVLGIASAGYDIGDSLSAAVRGSIGSPFAIFSATLKRSIPLLFLGLSVAIAFRAGVLNIGGDGQFLMGAAAGVAVGLSLPPNTPAPLLIGAEVVAGVAAGALWSAIAAWLLRRFRVSEVVGTLLLNFVALYFIAFLIRGPMQEPTGAYPQSATLPESAWLPQLIPGQQLHLGFAIALLLAGALWWYIQRTASGFRLRVTGTNPSVAESAGLIDVSAVHFRALIASGGIAGLAGVSEAAGVTHLLYENLSSGYGYAAIGVALLGRLDPRGIVVAAVVFGAIGAGADAMQRDARVPAELAAVLSALVILGMLAAPTLVKCFARDQSTTAAA